MSAAPRDIPMMAGESVDTAFGEKAGLGAEAARERNALLLTDRRVIRLARAKRGLAATFLTLGDIQAAEVIHRPRNAKRLFRMALLLAGAGAALVAIEWPPLAWALASLLGLGAAHHLYQYVSVSQEGSILFRTTQQELSIPYRGRGAEQAYDLVNRFFRLKAAYSPTIDRGDDGQVDGERVQRPGKPFRQLRPWGREVWYETWFLDRSVPIAEIRPRDGAEPGEYETWFLDRNVPIAEIRLRDGAESGEYETWFLGMDVPVSEPPPGDEAGVGRSAAGADVTSPLESGEVRLPQEDTGTAGNTGWE